jgi:hypothetical protein
MQKSTLSAIAGIFICSASAFGGVTVNTPANGVTTQSPVHFVASASTTCSGGVASMGIYAGSNLAYVVKGPKLDTTLDLAPGTHKVTVKEWNNCGSAGQALTITVSGPAENTSTVTGQSAVNVSAPTSNSTVSSPVHFVANATTSCSKGVSALGVYVNNSLKAAVPGSSLNTSLALSSGTHNTVVQSWDKCGGFAKKAVTLQVQGASAAGSGKTFYGLQKSGGWRQFGELAPRYDICTSCSGKVTWSMKQGITSPSRSGSATRFNLGGTIPYSDALWYNPLIGDFSTQGLPDTNKTFIATLHNFVYDVYFFGSDMRIPQSLEFDINQFTSGRSYIFGHECRIAVGHVWAVWDNPNNRWVDTDIPCHPVSNSWNHLILKVQRTSDNKLLYQSITLNGETHNLNWYNNSTPSSWHGVTVNYQSDGNYKQQPYSIYLDDFNFTYY